MQTINSIEEAKTLYNEEKYQEVIEILKEYTASYQEDENASYRLLAYSYYFLRDYDSSLTYFTLLKRNKATFNDLDYLRTGQSFYKQNNMTKAVEYFKLAQAAGGDAVFEGEDKAYLDLLNKSSSFANPKPVYLNSSQTRKQARLLLKGKWIKLILINALVLVAFFALLIFTFLAPIFDYLYYSIDVFTPSIIIMGLVGFLLTYLINAGLSIFNLNYVKSNGESIKLSLLFSFFSLKIFMMITPYLLILASILFFTILVPFLGLLLAIPTVYVFSQLEYTAYESVYENKKMKSNILLENNKLMYGHKARYFIVMLSFIGWNLLSGTIVNVIDASTSLPVLVGLTLMIFAQAPLTTYTGIAQAIFYRNLTSDQFDNQALESNNETGELQIKDNYPLLINNFLLKLQDLYSIDTSTKDNVEAIINTYHTSLHNDITYYTKRELRQDIISSAINKVEDELHQIELQDDIAKRVTEFIFNIAFDYGYIK